MIDTITTTSTIPYNFVLIKSDPSYDFHEVATPDGKVELKLLYFNQDKSKYLSISGKIVALPDECYYGDEKRNALEFAADCDISIGDRVFFDYREQIDSEAERRLVRHPELGLCVLVRRDRLYGVWRYDTLQPINGWVFFKRDQLPDRLEMSGLEIIQRHNKYESNFATVIATASPCSSHIDGQYEPQMDLREGDRVLLDKLRGFRISYEVGNDEVRDLEVIHRKDISGICATTPI